MSRRSRVWRRCWACTAAVLLLAGCATTRAPQTPLDATAQHSVLAELARFSADGRVAVSARGDGFNASVRWKQQGDESTVKLAGPFGAGGLQLQLVQGQLRIKTSSGQQLQGEEAAQTVRQQLGFDPPLAALRYWMLGLPAPEEGAVTETREDGLLRHLTQQDWQISYDSYRFAPTAQGIAQLPARITATRDGVRLRLVIDRWRLQRSGS
jgi:outer membrane lipoprotein LolB